MQNAKSDLEETQPQKKAERSEQPDRPARIEQPEEEPQNEEEDEEEDWEGFSPKEFVQDVTARAQGVLGFFKRRKEPAGGKADTADRLSRSDSGLEKQTESGSETSAENDSAAVMEDETGKKAGNDWKETTAQRDWSEPGEDSWEEDESDSGLLGRKRIRLTDTMEESERFRPSKWGIRKPSKTETAETEKQPESESTEKSEDEAEKSAEKSEDGPEDFSQRQKLEKLMESGRNAEMKEIPETDITIFDVCCYFICTAKTGRKINKLQPI